MLRTHNGERIAYSVNTVGELYILMYSWIILDPCCLAFQDSTKSELKTWRLRVESTRIFKKGLEENSHHIVLNNDFFKLQPQSTDAEDNELYCNKNLVYTKEDI